MLDQLKELLGEELSAQVQEKLGEVELAIFNNGTVVPADKYDSLKAEHKSLTEKYQTDISGLNSKLENAMTNAADYDSLKGTLETLQAENNKIAEEHQQELINSKKSNAVELALIKANLKDGYLPLIKSQINTESLSFDGDNLIGLTDTIQSVQQQYPDMFGQVKKVGINPENGLAANLGKKQQLIEQYNTAEKNGDSKQMFALDRQIKNLKE